MEGVIKISELDKVGGFGPTFKFNVNNVIESRQPSTLKTNIGKKFIEKEIPLRNTTDLVLEVSGVITGLSRISGQTEAAAIEADRDSLVALEDGYKHDYFDGRHGTSASTLNFAIVPRSLRMLDEENRSPGQPYKFIMSLKQWQ